MGDYKIKHEMARSAADPSDHALKLAESDGARCRDARSATVRNVVVVEDGSTDVTAQVSAGLDVTVLHNEENLEKAGSLSCGG
jgi:beta-phosphoglucomutase-like phosphatase (HAD superfamily)